MTEKTKFKAAKREAIKADWAPFFTPGTEVMALPGWSAPRLFISAERPMQRWRLGAFYLAFRPRARAFRLALQVWAALGLSVQAKMMYIQKKRSSNEAS